ncbi:MAG: S8 family serine peptidase [Candidatus Latescibacterota bacterium]|nr:MAG: S8 family serine peptidase [Candidatus Latescibacterota bacterium]
MSSAAALRRAASRFRGSIAVLLLLATVANAGAATTPWFSKVAPELLGEATAGEAGFLVILREQADLGAAAQLRSKGAKGRHVFDTLSGLATESQQPILEVLEASGIEYRSFWVVNMLSVRGDLEIVERLARMREVARIELDAPLSRAEPRITPGAEGHLSTTAGIEWNVAKVNAPAVWAEGVLGEGAVVGGMDTGYQWDHPALVQQYRGWSPKAVQHDYNWHDAIHLGGDFECPADSPEPCDSDGHGTHTMGTILGDDGINNQIGVAPGARWIGCRCWEPIRRTALSYVTECFQWFIAPTDMRGANPDPAMAPHAISNSWICEPSEGCKDPNVLRAIVENVRAAGIVVVAAAGNSGPGCASILHPPAIYDASFTVGATTSTDEAAAFSSRGPVLSDGGDRLKPDIVAPGQNVRSAIPGNGFQGGWSGTSMATPHVAGAIALLVSAVPELAGEVEVLEEILVRTAVPLTSDQACGSVSGQEIPNNTFGFGRLDVLAAVEYARSLTAIHEEPPAEQAASRPHQWRLLPNVPNPFNPATRIDFELAERAPATLRIYDVAGRLVRELADGRIREAGVQSVYWDGLDAAGRPVPSGVYIYQLRGPRFERSRPMTLVR